MKKSSRYDTSGHLEDQYEPGSRKRVLKNLLGLKSKKEIERIESIYQYEALNHLIDTFGQKHRFSSKDICELHRIWLGKVYAWAGSYRTVNITKDNFTFAMARQVPQLMDKFEKKVLSKYTPCGYKSLEKIAEALAIVHVELVLIHPFREGNGRVARMLSILMALQAGLPTLDFSLIEGKKKKDYFLAIRLGLENNYISMVNIFSDIIEYTNKRYSEQK